MFTDQKPEVLAREADFVFTSEESEFKNSPLQQWLIILKVRWGTSNHPSSDTNFFNLELLVTPSGAQISAELTR